MVMPFGACLSKLIPFCGGWLDQSNRLLKPISSLARSCVLPAWRPGWLMPLGWCLGARMSCRPAVPLLTKPIRQRPHLGVGSFAPPGGMRASTRYKIVRPVSGAGQTAKQTDTSTSTRIGIPERSVKPDSFGEDSSTTMDGVAGYKDLLCTAIRRGNVEECRTMLNKIWAHKKSAEAVGHLVIRCTFATATVLAARSGSLDILDMVISLCPWEVNLAITISDGGQSDGTSRATAYGSTPLYHAAMIGWAEGCHRLLAAGADMRWIHPVQKMSPFHVAISHGHTRAVNMFLDAGADPNVSDANGRPPCIIATLTRQSDVLAILLARCADPDACCATTGDSAAVLAVRYSNSDALELLIEHGADLSAACSLIGVSGHPPKSRAVVRILTDAISRGALSAPPSSACWSFAPIDKQLPFVVVSTPDANPPLIIPVMPHEDALAAARRWLADCSSQQTALGSKIQQTAVAPKTDNTPAIVLSSMRSGLAVASFITMESFSFGLFGLRPNPEDRSLGLGSGSELGAKPVLGKQKSVLWGRFRRPNKPKGKQTESRQQIQQAQMVKHEEKQKFRVHWEKTSPEPPMLLAAHPYAHRVSCVLDYHDDALPGPRLYAGRIDLATATCRGLSRHDAERLILLLSFVSTNRYSDKQLRNDPIFACLFALADT